MISVFEDKLIVQFNSRQIQSSEKYLLNSADIWMGLVPGFPG